MEHVVAQSAMMSTDGGAHDRCRRFPRLEPAGSCRVIDALGDAHVRILGPAEFELGGALVHLPAPKERGLLVILALQPGSAVSSQALADVLWGAAAPEKYRKSLQVLVSRVRRRIQETGGPDGHDLVVTAGDAYLLRVPCAAVDACRFEQLSREGRDALGDGRAAEAASTLEQALAMWRGQPIPEVADTPGGRAEAARLAEMRRSALEHLHEAELALGHHGDLVARLEVLVAAEPLHETLWRQLMLALYRSGRQGDALRAYQRARVALVDELGIEPGAELRRLEAAVVAQDPALDWTAEPAGSSPTVAAGASRIGHGSPRAGGQTATARASAAAWATPRCSVPLVDRVAELRVLDAAFEEARSGTAVVVIDGDDSTGKTRLLAEAVTRCSEQGSFVLVGDCGPDRRAPGAALRQAVDRWAEHYLLDADGLRPGARAALATLSSAYAERTGTPATEGARGDPYALAGALAAVFRSGTDGAPSTLVLDDVHAAGRFTLDTVRSLIGDHDDLDLLVLLALRGTEVAARSTLLDLLVDLQRGPRRHRISLGGLGIEPGVALLVEGAAVPDGDAWHLAMATLVEQAAGRPGYLLELAAHIAERRSVEEEDWVPSGLADLGLPDAIIDLVRRRRRSLDGVHQELLGAAAVLGPSFELDTLVGTADLGIDEVIRALEAAASAGLVSEVGQERFAFTSTVVQHAVYQDLSATRRARLHRAAGAATADRSDRPVDERLADATDHFARSRLAAEVDADPEVVEARYEQAYDDAVGKLQSVPGLEARAPDDPERRFLVLMGLAEGRRRSDDFAAARAIFDMAIDEARRLQSPQRLAEAVLGTASVMVEVGVSHQPLIDLIRHAARGLDQGDPLRVELDAALVPELVWSGDWDEAMALSRAIAADPAAGPSGDGSEQPRRELGPEPGQVGE